jgi:hypothetical protein
MRASQHFPGKRFGVRSSVILAPRPAQGTAAAMAEAAGRLVELLDDGAETSSLTTTERAITRSPGTAQTSATPPADPEDTMPASTHSRKYRPAGAPPYYLGRPAHWWITAFARRGRANDADRTIVRTSTSQEKR